MSQGSIQIPTAGPLAPSAVAALINAALETLATQASGTSAPSSVVAGQFFLNTAVSTAWTLSIYDGAQMVLIGTINPVTHTFTPNLSGLGASLPTTSPTPGSNQLWNNGGVVMVA